MVKNTRPAVEETPSAQVAALFHADLPRRQCPVRLGRAWDNGWRYGDTVLMRVVGGTGGATAWSARLREHLVVPGARVARPVRSTDGRFTAAGWRAAGFVPGDCAARIDETALLGLRLEEALRDAEPAPADGSSIFHEAERAAWAGEPVGLDQTAAAAGLGAVAAALRDLAARLPVAGPNRVAHADLVSTTLYIPDDSSAPPTITDIVGVNRPAGYTSAQVIADGLIAGAVDPGIVTRFGHVPNLRGLLARAVLYRLFLAAHFKPCDSNVCSLFGRVYRTVVAPSDVTN